MLHLFSTSIITFLSAEAELRNGTMQKGKFKTVRCASALKSKEGTHLVSLLFFFLDYSKGGLQQLELGSLGLPGGKICMN